jgi:hypothetical protein
MLNHARVGGSNKNCAVNAKKIAASGHRGNDRKSVAFSFCIVQFFLGQACSLTVIESTGFGGLKTHPTKSMN